MGLQKITCVILVYLFLTTRIYLYLHICEMCIRKTLQSKEKCIKLTQDLTVHKLIIYILYVLSIVLFFE